MHNELKIIKDSLASICPCLLSVVHFTAQLAVFPKEISLPLNQFFFFFLNTNHAAALGDVRILFLNPSAHDSLLGRSDDVPLRSPGCVCR